ncbi:carbamoyltransferase HypF [Legionella quateirensis]|uniref:Carbamoyltransferase HypF n=1 Tax=Legionella quateirensis TaxID=45072 RepID=A0A378L4F1_9GAMM|nr:carbamoyltransferase HypF [Legionella quateirensis]KTD46221.1 hydrogenase maturation protein HypF [Legionella quateirensis]STY19010.1 hydrogenase maturation protein HypF [Legionella quateirensis]
MELKRLQITIQGQVQGVGFRPCVYRIAKTLGLTGWIQNNAAGVFIEIQGRQSVQFIDELKNNLPPLAKLSNAQSRCIPLIPEETGFKIRESTPGKVSTVISPDTCVCPQCLNELFDPQSHYSQYPFLNCTHCGPRYSITRGLPYDRCQTSMDAFPLCGTCTADYLNPENRRYHAQPTACADCGPQLSLSIDDVAKRLLLGELIALKGLGGYQLICDARNEASILKLRACKNREAKPLALMVANGVSAEALVDMTEQGKTVLESRARPIVLFAKKDQTVPDALAPGLNHLGVMLPYTPIHYLLFHTFAGKPDGCQWLDEFQEMILVVTSANIGGEPLIIDDHEAGQNLSGIADTIVSYNRQIVTRADDSVVHMLNDTPVFIRRSRGYVPHPIQLPRAIPSILAVGGHLKNTFCITRGDEAFVSQHIGSLTNKATIEFFHESLDHLLRFLDVEPERIAHDLHPDFYTTRFAEHYGIPAYAIQHHHAHLASVAAEHHIDDPVIGLALDGYGYGSDGTAWGGELLLLEGAEFTRLGHLACIPQPGGEIAAREPWRMAASVLHHLGRGHEIAELYAEHPPAHALHVLLEQGINCPLTSSCGRIFDAVSALLGIQTLSFYEGQAPMRLESLVTVPQILKRGWRIKDNIFDMMPTLDYLSDLADPVIGANVFHGTLIAGLAEWIIGACQERGLVKVLLSGGCFLNKVVTEGLTKALINSGITPLFPRNLPPNDGGISLGQAWITGIM